MPSASAFYIIMALHGLLLGAVILSSHVLKRRLHGAHYLWMLMLPIIGPLSGWMQMRAEGRTPPGSTWIRRNDEAYKNLIMAHNPVKDTVPLEEALLINDPNKRRTMMMNILRSDPLQYLDLLLVARFNEDTETAHYATATIMELQRQFQLEIQQRQLELDQNEEDIAKHKEYAAFLSRYCESGLLEGQLLRRQRLVLKKALDRGLSIEIDPALLSMRVRNSLALNESADAKAAAQTLMNRWTLHEVSWLESMRCCVETRDQSGMQSLLQKLRETPVDLTSKGREQLLFWTEKRK